MLILQYAENTKQVPESGTCFVRIYYIPLVYQPAVADIWLIRYERFDVNSFTEIARRIIPKNLRVK